MTKKVKTRVVKFLVKVYLWLEKRAVKKAELVRKKMVLMPADVHFEKKSIGCLVNVGEKELKRRIRNGESFSIYDSDGVNIGVINSKKVMFVLMYNSKGMKEYLDKKISDGDSSGVSENKMDYVG